MFEFYADILGPGGARRDILARLGNEAGDVIDEFQNYAVATEKTGLPGLQAFLEILDAAAPEIKRELDQSRNEVRIMTSMPRRDWKRRWYLWSIPAVLLPQAVAPQACFPST